MGEVPANADGVDVPPVGLDLRVHLGVPVHLRRRGDEDARLHALRETAHVVRA